MKRSTFDASKVSFLKGTPFPGVFSGCYVLFALRPALQALG
jgi:hypothetical protein